MLQNPGKENHLYFCSECSSNLLVNSVDVYSDSTDPPENEKIIRSNKYIFLVCKSYYTNTGFALFIAVSFYILTVALLCTYDAFNGRNIPENFKEVKCIGFSICILPLSSIVYYPAAFTFESWHVTLVSCLTTLVSAFGLLGCMFGPKAYILLFHSQQNTVECVRVSSIGRTGYSSFFGGNVIKVGGGGNKLRSLTS